MLRKENILSREFFGPPLGCDETRIRIRSPRDRGAYGGAYSKCVPWEDEIYEESLKNLRRGPQHRISQGVDPDEHNRTIGLRSHPDH